MNSKTQPVDFRREVPHGDTHERDVCATCGFVNYVNPKIVTGSIVRHVGRILLCRRAIEPRIGFWTLPAGFMELGETAEQAAMREAREEANAAIVIDRLLAVYTIPRIAQVQIMYLAHLGGNDFSAGPESLEVMLAGWDEIPWEELAFPSVRWALEQYRSVEGSADFAPFSNPPGEYGDPKPL
ncbi:NUDIX domain-containing protein [Aestuariivirga sp.]|uniref:NUDIX hydrolase n=1 Tax=Aestuariivirga sp. TaxID=2650926 RepID=UPI00391D29D3